jgi:hypothetical protein
METTLGERDASEPSARHIGDHTVDASRPLLTVLAVLGVSIPIALYVWLTARDSLDVLRADQWYDVRLIQHSFNGTLSLSMLWAQHSDNRIFFQNLIMLLVAHLAHFNVLAQVYFDVVLLVGATALFVAAHRRRSPSTAWIWYCPFAVVMFSLAQWGDTLYGFQLGWYLVLAMTALVLFWLDRPLLTWIVLIGAVVGGVIASYSSLQGLFVWPVGLALMLQRSRPKAFMFAWITAGVLTTALYFYNYNSSESGGNLSFAFHQPAQFLRFYVFALGDIVGANISNSPSIGQYGVFVFGLVVLGVGVWAIVSSGLRVDVSSGRPVGVALVWTGLLFAGAIAAGRASDGLSGAGTSRYVTFDLLVVAGSYLVATDRFAERSRNMREGERPPRLRVAVPAAVASVVGILAVFGTVNGIKGADGDLNYEKANAVITVHIDRAPDGLVASHLGAGYQTTGFIRKMVAFTRSHRLALFSTSEAAQYARQSIPINSTPPLTVMAKPTAGQVLHGSEFLLAGASDEYGVTKVQFELRKGQSGSRVISQGSRTTFGWLGAWNTLAVPNGEYFLRSAAFAPGGLEAASPWVEVEVKN